MTEKEKTMCERYLMCLDELAQGREMDFQKALEADVDALAKKHGEEFERVLSFVLSKCTFVKTAKAKKLVEGGINRV